MLYPDTQTRLQLIREQQAMLRQQAQRYELDDDSSAQTTIRETRGRWYRIRLGRLRQSFRPATHPS
jgi:uncharacterized protein YbaR (Trm112 family)